jgi:hypothetical protein
VYTVIGIASKELVSDPFELLDSSYAAEWLDIARVIAFMSDDFNIIYGITLFNRLFLVVHEDEDITPLKFIINRVVKEELGVKPDFVVSVFETSIEMVESLASASKLSGSMLIQTLCRMEEGLYYPDQPNSITGGSVYFRDEGGVDETWNGDYYLPAISPLSENLVQDLDLSEEIEEMIETDE